MDLSGDQTLILAVVGVSMSFVGALVSYLAFRKERLLAMERRSQLRHIMMRQARLRFLLEHPEYMTERDRELLDDGPARHQHQ